MAAVDWWIGGWLNERVCEGVRTERLTEFERDERDREVD
jgi:hypothetical protein